jgi:DNA-binding SARP family transcriptional activator/Tfp pilus assembly protein PilF
MIGFRPKTSALFLERPRLLRMLPEEPGYIVWLEAPYGYGKSVLTAQWATKLEAEGWRVIWLALVEGDPRASLAGTLGLPDNTPWPGVLKALAREKTAVILEDLEGDPDAGASLGPLLKHTPGLVLLASRKPLRTPELPRARTEGRLIHLRAEHLAFTPNEAARLFGDQDSSTAWDRTRGWSLPLHLAALTGEVPEEDALWEGVRDSLEPDEWQEVLLLSALPYLPLTASDGRAERLSSLGFVQALENGFRLHPMAAEIMLKNHHQAVINAVQNNLERLPLVFRAQACARTELIPELHGLLEHLELATEDSVGVLRWDTLCRAQGVTDDTYSPARWLTLGWAYSATGQILHAREVYTRVAAHPLSSPDQRLNALGFALYDLPHDAGEQAQPLLDEAERVMGQASTETQAGFFSNAFVHMANTNRWSDAEALLERAVRLPPNPEMAETRINLAMVRYQLHGAALDFINTLEASLKNHQNNYNLAGIFNQLAELYAWLNPQKALEYLNQLESVADAVPHTATLGRALTACLRGDLGAFPALELEAQQWHGSYVGTVNPLAMVYAYWAKTLRFAGQGERILGLLGPHLHLGVARMQIEYAFGLHAAGRSDEALVMIEPFLAPDRRRASRIEAAAVKAQITQSAADIETLINMTDARETTLGQLIPFEGLPRLNPRWSLGYPMQTVLRSGWKDAVQHRHTEIPPLEVRMLGGFEVRLLGEAVTLTARPRDILALLTLRLPRDQIAEALWPDADTDKSRNNLHVNLNALRKAVEPWGVPTYILESGLARANVDLWNLEAALGREDFKTVRELYADLAPEFDLELLEGYRNQLRERVLDGLLGYAETVSDDAEDTLEAILKIDPLNEEAFSRLLERMVASGRRVSAERRFREFSRRLRDELGLEPSSEMRRVLRIV